MPPKGIGRPPPPLPPLGTVPPGGRARRKDGPEFGYFSDFSKSGLNLFLKIARLPAGRKPATLQRDARKPWKFPLI